MQLNTRKINNTIKKWAKELNRYFSKEDIELAKKHIRRCSTSHIIREIEIKTTIKYHLTLIVMAAIKKSTNNKCWQECGEKETLLHCWWECKLVQSLWRTVWIFLKKKNWKENCHMTQQSLCWAYTSREPELKETCVLQCSLQHIARTWKQPRCQSANEWIRKLWYITQWNITQLFKRTHLSQF